MKNEEHEETSILKGQRVLNRGYPVLVAILVTCACLLDVYTSMGCDFIRLEIGFEPVNDVWQDSGAQFGLFYFDSPGTITKESNFALFNKGCQVYTTSFEDNFISMDVSWNSSRFMAYITGISGVLGTVAAWLLAISPCSWLSKTMWMAVLRVTMVLSTCAGAAMFVFFNTGICTEDLWLEDEQSSRAAESCQIGESAIFGLASCLAFFICSILVLMRSPASQEEKYLAGEGTVRTSPTDMIIDTLERGEGIQLELVPEREDYQIGELLRNPSHVINDLPESCVLQFVNELQTNDCCFVKRSAGDFFSYAQLDYRTAEDLIFQMCREGSTKSVKRKNWAKSLRFPSTEGLERVQGDTTPQKVEITTPKVVNGHSTRFFNFSDDSTLGTAEFPPEPKAEIEQPRMSRTTSGNSAKSKCSFQILNFSPASEIEGSSPRVAILNGTGVLGESVATVTDFNSTPLNLLSNVLIWVEDARNLKSCFEYYRDIDMEGLVVHTYGGKPLSTRIDFETISGRKLEDHSWEQMERKLELEKELTGVDELIDSLIDEAKEAVRGLG